MIVAGAAGVLEPCQRQEPAPAPGPKPSGPLAFTDYVNVKRALEKRQRVRAELARMSPSDNVVKAEGAGLPSSDPVPVPERSPVAFVGGATPTAVRDDGHKGSLVSATDFEDPFYRRIRLNGELAAVRDYLRRLARVYAERCIAPTLSGDGPILLSAGTSEPETPRATRLSPSDVLVCQLKDLLRGHKGRLDVTVLRDRLAHTPDAVNRIDSWVGRFGADFLIISGDPEPAAEPVARAATGGDADKGALAEDQGTW
jgi:hypothetical protein